MELKKNTRTSNMRRGCTTPNKSALNEGGRCKKHFAHTPLSVTEKPKAVLMFVAIQELTASSCSTFFQVLAMYFTNTSFNVSDKLCKICRIKVLLLFLSLQWILMASSL